MARFAWLDVPGGGRVPVNPDQVCYLKRGRAERAVLVFGAVTGGLHELELEMSAEAALAALEARAGGIDLGWQMLTQLRIANALAPIYGPPSAPA